MRPVTSSALVGGESCVGWHGKRNVVRRIVHLDGLLERSSEVGRSRSRGRNRRRWVLSLSILPKGHAWLTCRNTCCSYNASKLTALEHASSSCVLVHAWRDGLDRRADAVIDAGPPALVAVLLQVLLRAVVLPVWSNAGHNRRLGPDTRAKSKLPSSLPAGGAAQGEGGGRVGGWGGSGVRLEGAPLTAARFLRKGTDGGIRNKDCLVPQPTPATTKNPN